MHDHRHDQTPLYEGMPEGLPRDYGHFQATALEDDWPVGRASLLAVAALVLISIAASWPILRQPDHLHLPACSEPYDAAIYPWNLFWFAESWDAEDGSLLATRRLYWPEGESLALYTPTYGYGLMAWPLLAAGDARAPFVATALLLVFSTLATALLAYRLARTLGANEAGAFVAALLFTFAAGRWMNAARLNLFCTEFLLLYLLSLLGFLRRGGLMRGLGLAIAATALLLQSQPLFFQGALATGAVLAVILGSRGVRKLFWRRAPHWTLPDPEHAHPPGPLALLACVAAFALLSGPFLWEMGRALQDGGPALQQWRNLVDLPDSSLDAAALLHPSQDDRLWSALLGDAARPRSFFEGQAAGASVSFFLGLPWLLLVAWAILRASWRRWLPLCAATGIVFWLALGPTVRWGGEATAVPGAYDLLSWFPPVRLGKSPVRWVLLVQLGLALLAGLGADRLLRPRPDLPGVARWRAVLLALLCAGALFEASETLPLRSVQPSRRVPDEIVALGQEDARFAVLDLPYGAHRVNATAMALGAVHRRPIFFGLFPRATEANREAQQDTALFRHLQALESWSRPCPVITLSSADLPADAAVAAAAQLEALDPRVLRVEVEAVAGRLQCWLSPELGSAELAQAGAFFAQALAERGDFVSEQIVWRVREESAPAMEDPDQVRLDLEDLRVGCVLLHELADAPAAQQRLTQALAEQFSELAEGPAQSASLGEAYELSLLRFPVRD